MPSTSRRRSAGRPRRGGRTQPDARRKATQPDQRRDAAKASSPPEPPPPVQIPSGGDPTRRHRLVAGAALLLAPATFLAGQVVLIPVSAPGAGLGIIAEHLGAWRTAYALLLAAAVLNVPMVLALGHLLRRRAPLWADAGSGMAILGTMAATTIALVAFIVAELAVTGGAQAEAVLERTGPLLGGVDLVQDLFLLGMVLLLLGLWHHRLAPLPALTLALAGQALSWGPTGLQLAAAALQLIGLAWIALIVLRWPDEHWSAPPEFPTPRRAGLLTALVIVLFVASVWSISRFLALVEVFLVLVIYRPASPWTEPAVDTGKRAAKARQTADIDAEPTTPAG